MTVPRGRVALVTGAAGRLGRIATWRLAADDVAVAAVDIDGRGLDRVARHAPQVHRFVTDVTDAQAVHALVEQVERSVGPIARVVNAARAAVELSADPDPGELLEATVRTSAVDHLGAVRVTLAALPHLESRGHGEIVLVGSAAGTVALGCGPTASARAAVHVFADALAERERDRGVHVVCLRRPVAGAVDGVQAEDLVDAVEAALAQRRHVAEVPKPGRRAAVLFARR